MAGLIILYMEKKSCIKNRKCDIMGEVGSVAQLVEQRPEEPCVAGSSPAGTTKIKLRAVSSVG